MRLASSASRRRRLPVEAAPPVVDVEEGVSNNEDDDSNERRRASRAAVIVRVERFICAFNAAANCAVPPGMRFTMLKIVTTSEWRDSPAARRATAHVSNSEEKNDCMKVRLCACTWYHNRLAIGVKRNASVHARGITTD